MTAEIALLNKSAVALAADSAVTIQQGQDVKIYNSVNKLFSLSKFAPVGVMIYGTAALVGTPWETIIKLYRQSLGDRLFDTIEDYAKNFLEVVRGQGHFFPESQQESFVRSRLAHVFVDIHMSILEEISGLADAGNEVAPRKTASIYTKRIREARSLISKWDNLDGFDDEFEEEFARVYGRTINTVIGMVFKARKLTGSQMEMLRDIACKLMSKDFFPSSSYSGIVIAGFGDKEVFPALDSFHIDGVVLGKMRYKRFSKYETSHENTACVQSFAQRESVEAFMDGIHPVYSRKIREVLRELVDGFSEYAPLATPNLDDAEKQRLTSRLKSFGKKILDDALIAIDDYERKAHSDPILTAVQFLPRDELATMAETLVNLTSFRQRISLNSETVGGPIDVAVISKGDGFIWIKRKHYFEPQLNHHFFANYYRRGGRSDDGSAAD